MVIMMINNIKKCGSKSEMGPEEKKYYELKLNGQYNILHQLGRCGMRTSAYLVTDRHGNQFVIKIPNDFYDEHWIESQKKTITIKNNMFDLYEGEVLIPREVEVGDNYIVDVYSGADFENDVYDYLNENDKEIIEEDMARFLIYMHGRQKINEIQPFSFRTPNEDLLSFFEDAIDDDTKEKIKQQIEQFNNRDISDEIVVSVHSDLRSQNILYDKSKNKLAVIDFELAGQGNIYKDFVPHAAASFKMSYIFWNKVILKYNDLCVDPGLKVNLEKIKLFQELGVWNEYLRCAYYRKDDVIKVKTIINNQVKPLIAKIEKSYEEVINTNISTRLKT